jgi:hypothetical protein
MDILLNSRDPLQAPLGDQAIIGTNLFLRRLPAGHLCGGANNPRS